MHWEICRLYSIVLGEKERVFLVYMIGTILCAYPNRTVVPTTLLALQCSSCQLQFYLLIIFFTRISAETKTAILSSITIFLSLLWLQKSLSFPKLGLITLACAWSFMAVIQVNSNTIVLLILFIYLYLSTQKNNNTNNTQYSKKNNTQYTDDQNKRKNIIYLQV